MVADKILGGDRAFLRKCKASDSSQLFIYPKI